MAKKRAKKSTGAKKATAREAARAVSARTSTERSAPSRRKNILANTANARITGHARGAHRAAQAKRDAKQRGESA